MLSRTRPDIINICVNCSSDKTYVDKKGRHNWRIVQNKRYCSKCWWRLFENPRSAKNRILFKNRRIHLKFNPRKGLCQVCGYVGKTDMHHFEYHEDDPLRGAIELCSQCHAKIDPRPIDANTGRFISA